MESDAVRLMTNWDRLHEMPITRNDSDGVGSAVGCEQELARRIEVNAVYKVASER
jgi:hypothetical protein